MCWTRACVYVGLFLSLVDQCVYFIFMSFILKGLWKIASLPPFLAVFYVFIYCKTFSPQNIQRHCNIVVIAFFTFIKMSFLMIV